MADYQNWLLLRRIRSRQQVLETMTEFWENHFNVPVGADGVYTWRVRYGHVIRKHAPGLVRVAATGGQRAPGDGHLSRQCRLRQGPSQREPGSRAPGAPHRRARCRVQGARRRRLRTDPHRLAGRHVEHLGGVLRQGLALSQAGPRPRLPQQEPLGRRQEGDPRVPALPGAPPGHGHPHRDQAGHGVRLGPTARTRW